MATKRFTLNGGKPMTLNEIARTVVLNYAKAHTTASAQDISDLFMTTFKGIGVAHIVETQPQYLKRSRQKSWKRSADEIIIPNGQKLYVSTQWKAGNPDSNFFKFKDIVNKRGWGIIV